MPWLNYGVTVSCPVNWKSRYIGTQPTAEKLYKAVHHRSRGTRINTERVRVTSAPPPVTSGSATLKHAAENRRRPKGSEVARVPGAGGAGARVRRLGCLRHREPELRWVRLCRRGERRQDLARRGTQPLGPPADSVAAATRRNGDSAGAPQALPGPDARGHDRRGADR